MTMLRLCGKKVQWGDAVLFLLLFITLADAVLYNDARASKDLFADYRVFPQALKILCLAMMAVYTLSAYRLPALFPLRIFEYMLWFLVVLIALSLARNHRLYQLACAGRAYFWIFAYFFFRLTVHTISNLRAKVLILSGLVLLLGVQVHLAAISWTEAHHPGQMEAFSSNIALCLQFVMLFILCYYRFSAKTLVLFLCCAGLIFLSSKRSVIVSTGFSVGMLVVAYLRLRHYKTAGSIMVGAVLAVLPVIWVVYPQVAVRFQEVYTSDGSQRLWRYAASYNRWYDADSGRRLIGYGFFETPFYLQDIYYRGRRGDDRLPLHSHSDLFQILPDLGLVGLAQFALMHLALLGILWRCWKQREAALPAMMVFYICYGFISLLNGALARFETVYLMLPLATLCSHLEAGVQKDRRRDPAQNTQNEEGACERSILTG